MCNLFQTRPLGSLHILALPNSGNAACPTAGLFPPLVKLAPVNLLSLDLSLLREALNSWEIYLHMLPNVQIHMLNFPKSTPSATHTWHTPGSFCCSVISHHRVRCLSPLSQVLLELPFTRCDFTMPHSPGEGRRKVTVLFSPLSSLTECLFGIFLSFLSFMAWCALRLSFSPVQIFRIWDVLVCWDCCYKIPQTELCLSKMLEVQEQGVARVASFEDSEKDYSVPLSSFLVVCWLSLVFLGL